VAGSLSLGVSKKQSEPCGEIHSAGPFFYIVDTRFWSRYGYVIRMTAADDALYLSVLFPLRLAHPPLCIPWKEITLSRMKRFLTPKVALTYVVLTLGNREKIHHAYLRTHGSQSRNPESFGQTGVGIFGSRTTLSNDLTVMQRQYLP
jgi:hypothetical protein